MSDNQNKLTESDISQEEILESDFLDHLENENSDYNSKNDEYRPQSEKSENLSKRINSESYIKSNKSNHEYNNNIKKVTFA